MGGSGFCFVFHVLCSPRMSRSWGLRQAGRSLTTSHTPGRGNRPRPRPGERLFALWFKAHRSMRTPPPLYMPKTPAAEQEVSCLAGQSRGKGEACESPLLRRGSAGAGPALPSRACTATWAIDTLPSALSDQGRRVLWMTEPVKN